MRQFQLIALISILWLTGCGHLGTIESERTIAAACPDVKVYSQEKQCKARAEAKALAASGVKYPVIQEMLVDSKVLRDQSRVCRGDKLPANKKPVCK